MDSQTALFHFNSRNRNPNARPVTYQFRVWRVCQVFAVQPRLGTDDRSLAAAQGNHQPLGQAVFLLQLRVHRWVTALKEEDSRDVPALAAIHEEERTNGTLQYIHGMVVELYDTYLKARQYDMHVTDHENAVVPEAEDDLVAAWVARAVHFAAMDDLYNKVDVELQKLYERVKGIPGNPFGGLTLEVQETMNDLGYAWEAFEPLHEEVERCIDLNL